MPSQTFVITRAPEVEPLDVRRLSWLLSDAYPNAELDVRESNMQQGESK